MKASLARWGETLAIRLPEAELAEIGLHEGASLDVIVKANTVVIAAAQISREQFVSQLWACKEAGINQEPLWDDSAHGSEIL